MPRRGAAACAAAAACCGGRLPAAAARERAIPWEYGGWRAFPTNYFGANPYGYVNPATPNTTLALMARHQLVGWGWQQGMYDFPCKADLTEECLQYAADNFSTYVARQGAPPVPSFVYRQMGGALLKFGHDVGEALNCSLNYSTWPTLDQACALTDAATERERRGWFVRDTAGRICCDASAPGPVHGAASATWFKAAPGAMDWWDGHIGGWLAANLAPARAVFFDGVDGLGCNWLKQPESPGALFGNCSAADLDPAQSSPAARAAESRAAVEALRRVAARLRVGGQAVIINSLRRMDLADGCVGMGWGEWYGNLSAIPNLMWFYEVWNATRDLPTAVRMLEDGVPKVVHAFSTNETEIENAMAAFLISQGEYDYFGVSRTWTDGGWTWWGAYDRVRCGRPRALPTRSGTVYRRRFERCRVEYDVACADPARNPSAGVGCGSIAPA